MIKKTRIFALLLAGLLSTSLWAGQETDEKVDALFTEWTKPGSPGAAVGVIREGQLLYSKGFGLANIETDTPITPESVFYLASVGKQFTTMAIALLQQDGKLDVDDDIRKYIPEFPDYGTTITIRHLIHHGSGIRDYLSLMDLAGLPFGTFHHDQDIVDMLARQKALNFTPGERYVYSNSGYFLLAVIVHRVSGKSLSEFAKERIFGPLDMQNSHFHDDYTHPIKGRAMSYYTGDDGELDVFLSTFDRVGSGGVYSGVIDLVKWDNNFYDHKVGGQQVHDWLHQKGKLEDGTELDYAWGLHISDYRGLPVVQHGGSLGGYRTAIIRFPEQRFSVIVLANLGSINSSGLGMEVAEIYLGDLMQEPAIGSNKSAEHEFVQIPEAVLKPLAGLYYNDEDVLARRILLKDGQLWYSRGPEPASWTSLHALGDDRFVMTGLPLGVNFNRQARQMSVSSEGEAPLVFERIDLAGIDSVSLEDLAGQYHNPEVELTVDLKASAQGIVVTNPRDRGNPVTFESGEKDLYVNLEFGALHFRRNDDRAITGFLMETGRVRGLYFERIEK
jgi:CubicO group peptidase (beta-lactamase class C family)